METYRLKNIVILILVLLNICLLALVASRSYAGHQADQALITNTTALLQRNNISIDASLLEGTSSSLVYSYTRDDTAELEFVTTLLGPITTQSDYGGGTHFYANANGSASFRSNGSFSLTMTSELYAENFREFVRTYCPAQYRLNTIQSDGDRTTVTATPYTDDFPVYNASITFIFEKQALISASGFLIPSAETAPEAAETITRSSAVIYLMDHCNEEGRVCNTITEISAGYILQSTVSAPLLLTPVYRIDTNTYSYYVNSITGHVSLAG